MTEIPNRSQIWHLDWGNKFTNSNEFAKPHYAVCLSADNEDSKVALFCPLTTCQEHDDQGHYAVRLNRQITGKECWALLQHVKSLDWKARAGPFKIGMYLEMK